MNGPSADPKSHGEQNAAHCPHTKTQKDVGKEADGVKEKKEKTNKGGPLQPDDTVRERIASSEINVKKKEEGTKNYQRKTETPKNGRGDEARGAGTEICPNSGKKKRNRGGRNVRRKDIQPASKRGKRKARRRSPKSRGGRPHRRGMTTGREPSPREEKVEPEAQQKHLQR